MNRLSVCLLSGGLDSCVAATLAKRDGDDLFLLSVNYGQVMQRELEAAQQIANLLSPQEFKTVLVQGFKDLSRSSRTDRSLIEAGCYPPDPGRGIPEAYPPGRDFSFIFIAAAWAESLILTQPDRYEGGRVVLGTNADDVAVYPDCRVSAYELIDKLLLGCTKAGVALGRSIRVYVPLLNMTKAEVLRTGLTIDAPVDLSWSCYEGGEEACGMCDPCLARLHAFSAAGRRDRCRYRSNAAQPAAASM